MAQIVIVGLGPGDPALLTREAWTVLSEAGEIWLRTARHPVTSGLPAGVAVHSFDEFYESQETFEEVYAAIAEQVLALGRREAGVVYGVPGDPMMGESTVLRILDRAESAEVPVRIVSGLSFLEPTLAALQLDGLDGLQIVDALEMLSMYHPPVVPDVPALIAQVYDRAVASQLKLVLMNQYPDEHRTALVDAAGTAAEMVQWIPLYAIDRHDLSPLTSLYVTPYVVEPAPGTEHAGVPRSSFAGFQETIARLRSAEGCPWDREQTHASLRTNLIEEAYEVLSAIDEDDPDALREELGDLLLQVVLHTQIAVEEGEFQMPEVIAGIDAKLKHRHPHVWGNVHVENAGEVSTNWETIKRQERETHGDVTRSLLDGVPKALPALAQAYAYGSRVARVGFDWPNVEGVIETLHDEIEELLEAQTPEEQVSELGDLLFSAVNWARWLQVDPESALRETNARFARRFRRIEEASRQQGIPLEEMDFDALEDLWELAKREEASEKE